MPQHDDHNDLAALDFSTDETGPDGAADSDALDFTVPDDHSGVESAVDALNEYAPTEPDDTGTELDAIDSQTQAFDEAQDDDEVAVQMFTVTNPPESVSVSALIDGRTQRVELSPKVANMTESELADEILVIADLARQKGLAGQHTYLLQDAELSESMSDMGLDGNDALRDFMENGLKLRTPEQAETAQAEVFATRYTTDK